MDETELTPTTTLATLRMFAEPFRWQAYQALRLDGPKTALSLGKDLAIGESLARAALKALQAIGFTAVVDESAPLRRQLWRAIPGGVRLDLDKLGGWGAPEVRAWIKADQAGGAEIVRRFADSAEHEPPDWQAAAEMYSYLLVLKSEELLALGDQLREVMAHWLDVTETNIMARDAGWGEGLKPVFAVTQAVPYIRGS